MTPTFHLKVGDVEYAVPVECPHRKGWLSRGKVNRTKQGRCFLVCPLHYSTFDVQTGQQVSGPAARNLAVRELNGNASEMTPPAMPVQQILQDRRSTEKT